MNERLKVTKKKITIRCTARKNKPIEWAYEWFQKYDNITIDIGYSDSCNGVYGTWINNVLDESKFITVDWKGVDTEDEEPDYDIMSKQYSNHLNQYGITPGIKA